MLSRSDVTSAFQHLAGRHGLDSLALDEHDSAVIEFGEEGAIIFEFSEPQGTLTLWAPLCSLDSVETFEEEHKLLKALMALNFPGSRLHGARVALNEDVGMILLAREASIPPGQPEMLVDQAQNFAVDVEQILASLKDGSLLGEDAPLNLPAPAEPASFIRA